MPDALIEGLWDRKILKVRGPHASKTVSRRLTNWSTLHQWKGVEGRFDDPGPKKAVRLAIEGVGTRTPTQESQDCHPRCSRPSLGDLQRIAAIDLRDRAMLLMAFVADGRQRSKVASLRHSQITVADPIKLRPDDLASPTVP
jgi:hypothetical protein